MIDRRPRTKTEAKSRMKVHLRLVPIGDTVYRVVTLRPSDAVRFSTNFYHNTWHILGDRHSSKVLARLMWGLAYQRQPDTLIAIHGRHLCPSPFNGEKSFPVLLFNSHLTPIRPKHFRRLKAELRRTKPSKTVRWHTFGMDRPHEFPDRWPKNGERMFFRDGFICYTAVPEQLQISAQIVTDLDPQWRYQGMDYNYLADWDGEVQVFADYRERLSASIVAREQILAQDQHPTDPDALDIEIAERRYAILRGRRVSAKSG